jgi:hypothetical protein
VVRVKPIVSLLTAAIVVALSVTLVSSGMAASSSAPEITSVMPITNQQTQTITIQGHGFGNIQPELMDLGDGLMDLGDESVDTVWGKNTPSLVIYDKTNLLSAGAAGDWNGFTNEPPDLIGIILVSWSDTQIVLGGFGSGLGSRFSWSQVSDGDYMQIQIQTAGGFATYELVASGDGSSPSPPSSPSLASSYISITAEPLSTVAGSPVNVFGTLTDTNGDALQNKTIVLSYIFSGLDSWVPISSDLTDEQGKYSIQWINSASGTFTLKAEWSGDETNNGTSNQTSLSFLPYQKQQNFIFETNSTIYDLDFNASASSLRFNVTGPSGTTGYVNIRAPTSLINDPSSIKVYVDKELVTYTTTFQEDCWIISLTFHHSSHAMAINFGATNERGSQLDLSVMVISVSIVIVFCIGLLSYIRKRKR